MKTIKAIFDLSLQIKKENEKSDTGWSRDFWIGACSVCTGTNPGRYYQ
jgi:hypothetical protein